MQVLKFGGSSVASASTITKVINILKEASGKDKTIFVASAISGATDKLIEIDHGRMTATLPDPASPDSVVARKR